VGKERVGDEIDVVFYGEHKPETKLSKMFSIYGEMAGFEVVNGDMVANKGSGILSKE
jgi:hypothetical protein